MAIENAIEEVINSFKAKMHDFTYSPFFSSYIISWVILNYKFLMILFSDKDVIKKFELIKSVSNVTEWYSYLIPFSIALFYVFIYPWISLYFYTYTLNRDNEKNEAKLKALKQKPYPYAAAAKLFEESKKLQERIIELEGQSVLNIDETESKYNIIIDDLKKEHQRVQAEFQNKLIQKEQEMSAYDEHIQALNQMQNSPVDNVFPDDVIEQVTEMLDDMSEREEVNYLKLNSILENRKFISKQEIQKELGTSDSDTVHLILKALREGKCVEIKKDKFLVVKATNFSPTELKVMKLLYDSDFVSATNDDLIKKISQDTKLKRIQIENLIASLKSKNIIQINPNNHSLYIFSTNAKNILLDIFDDHLD